MDTRKNFNFTAGINGVTQAEIQEVTGLDKEITAISHGLGNRDVKTPGRVTIGDVTIKNVRPVISGKNAFWDWLNQAQNSTTGTGGVASQYKRNLTITERNGAGVTIATYVCYGVWVRKVTHGGLNRMGDDNIIDTAVLSIDDFVVI